MAGSHSHKSPWKARLMKELFVSRSKGLFYINKSCSGDTSKKGREVSFPALRSVVKYNEIL